MQTIVIDYLQLVTQNRPCTLISSEQKQKKIFSLLKYLAHCMDIPILILTQIPEGDKISNKPTLQQMLPSKQLQDSVDIVISTYRDSNNNCLGEILLLNELNEECEYVKDYFYIYDQTRHKRLEELSVQELYERYIIYRFNV